jgi:hypothetical protein
LSYNEDFNNGFHSVLEVLKLKMKLTIALSRPFPVGSGRIVLYNLMSLILFSLTPYASGSGVSITSFAKGQLILLLEKSLKIF